MNAIFYGLITLSIIVAVGFLVCVLVEVRSTLRALKEFLHTTECTLKPTIEELQQNLKSVRNVTDNLAKVTEDLTVISDSVRDVGEKVRLVSGVVEEVTSSAAIKVSGFRAGFRAAAEVLFRNLLTGKQR
ncbi:MAG: DUF948 domain-containing protein [Thermodesulfovibrionales bacterium]|jgi:uncharacterized protein YoxC